MTTKNLSNRIALLEAEKGRQQASIAKLEAELKEAEIQVACKERYLVSTEKAECHHIEEERKWKKRAETAGAETERLRAVIKIKDKMRAEAWGITRRLQASEDDYLEHIEKAEAELDTALDVCRKFVKVWKHCERNIYIRKPVSPNDQDALKSAYDAAKALLAPQQDVEAKVEDVKCRKCMGAGETYSAMSGGKIACDNITHDAQHPGDPLAKNIPLSTRFRGLIDRYIQGEMWVCLDIHSVDETGDLKGCDYIFTFQNSTLGDVKVFERTARRDDDVGDEATVPRPEEMQLSVPIFSSPVIEDSENMVGGLKLADMKVYQQFRSVVRLYRLNKSLTLVREWFDLPSGILECLAGGADRKAKILSVTGQFLTYLMDGGSVDSRVQSGSQIIEQFTKLEAELVGKLFVVWDDIKSPCPVALHMDTGAVGFAISKFFPTGGKRITVRLCAINSPTTFIKPPPSHDEY